jgi:hypothetical protein
VLDGPTGLFDHLQNLSGFQFTDEPDFVKIHL